ncbi:CRISPR-associated RAMP protein [Candidatus Magnetomoraceae bacterium gMMP-15]
MHQIKLDLTISFTSKWHSGSGEGSLILDRLVRKDARNRPYIPGSTLKGVVRESCEKLSRTLNFPAPTDPHQTDLKDFESLKSPIDRIFGNRYESADLFFRNARLIDEPPYGHLKEQTRICRYRKLGTAKEQHLFSTEYTVPMDFKTRIDGYHRDLISLEENDPPYAYCLLIAGIMTVDRLGGDKSTGNGQVKISVDSIEYNGKLIDLETIFEYLDSELYWETRS